jgi:hypothetical protein
MFDKLKKKLGDAKDQLMNPPQPPHEHPYQQPPYQQPPYDQQPYQQQYQQQYQHQYQHEEPEPHHYLDVAGFDPDDEDAFFHAVLHMESDGQYGGTDESRAEIMARYGIRDRSHWHTVKESVYTLLIARYGSGEEVGQREANWRMGQMQRHMQAQVARTAAGGGFAPVEGVSLEAWAAINASIVGGASRDDLLKGAGIDAARWDRVSAEWNARMARDTTFAIAQVYGNAFQAASKGKFADYAREAAAARAANRDLAVAPPITLEQYYEIMYEQAYAAKQGKDPVEALRSCGLSIVDWTDLGSFMGYFFHRTAVRHWHEYEGIHRGVQARFAAKYPGVTADVDIQL